MSTGINDTFEFVFQKERLKPNKCRINKHLRSGVISFDFLISSKKTFCHICSINCPVSAISGNPKETHIIDQDLCTKCGICFEKCPKKFNAIELLSGSKTI